MTGIYFLANDRMLDLAIAFLNSLRTFEPELPACLLPYDFDFGKLASLSNRYRFSIWSDCSVLERCDAISRSFHSDVSGHYRKLAIWEGPYQDFVYIDVDTILLSGLEVVFRLLAEHDVITAVSNLSTLRKFVWIGDTNRIPPSVDTQYSANTGFIASKKRIITLQDAERKVPIAQALKEHMSLEYAEQPFLNYLIITSGAKYTSLAQLRRATDNMHIPKQVWAGMFDEDLLQRSKLPLLIHWAGKWQKEDHLKSPTWRHFRDMRDDC
jgi:hypothetical protein